MINALLIAMAAQLADDDLMEEDSGAELVSILVCCETRNCRVNGARDGTGQMTTVARDTVGNRELMIKGAWLEHGGG